MTRTTLFSRPAFPMDGIDSLRSERFVPGTHLRTAEGAKPVEMLGEGDEVLTLDGPRRITKLERTVRPRSEWTYQRETWPVRVPVGSLGNPRPSRLSPDVRVILSGEIVERICGRDRIVAPVRELVGMRGLIVERPLADLRYQILSFEGPVSLEADGIPCLIDVEEGEGPDRDLLRETFQAMYAAGEPPLRQGDV